MLSYHVHVGCENYGFANWNEISLWAADGWSTNAEASLSDSHWLALLRPTDTRSSDLWSCTHLQEQNMVWPDAASFSSSSVGDALPCVLYERRCGGAAAVSALWCVVAVLAAALCPRLAASVTVFVVIRAASTTTAVGGGGGGGRRR